MSLPIIGQTKNDKILSQFSQKYVNKTLIGERILQPLKVKEKSGNYAKYGTENLRIYEEAIFRAPGVRAKSVDYTVSQGDYLCRERSLEKLIPDEFVNNQDDPYDAKRDAIATIMDVLWTNQEYTLASTMADTAVLTSNTTLTSTDQWSDYSNSDPIGDIQTGIETIRAATAVRPNTVVMGHEVFTKLKYHPDVREQVKYTGTAKLSDADLGSFLKDFFGVTEVLVGDAIYDSAVEGQSASLVDVWGNHFWLIYKNPRPTQMQATFGYTFFDLPRKVDTYRDEPKVSDVARLRYSYDQNIMDVNLAYLIKNAVA